MVAGDGEFATLLLEMRDLSRLRSKLEITKNKIMLDTCQHICKYVLY